MFAETKLGTEEVTTMKAIGWPHSGATTGAQLFEIATPKPGRGQVRVRVVSSAVNPADGKIANGEFAGRLLHARVSPLVAGYDFSGVIESCGEDVGDLKPGDEVFGFLAYSSATRQGAFAEMLTANRGEIARKPAGVSHETAAAAATPGATALQFLRDLGRLHEGGRVLIIGAAGGVGSLAVGIAKRLQAQVTAVCSTYAVDFVRGLGADEIVDRRKQDPLTVPGPFDVIFDAATAHSYLACRRQLAKTGSYVPTLPSTGLLVGMALAAFSSQRCAFAAVKSAAKDLEQVAAWLLDGLQAPIEARFPVRELGAAMDRFAKGELRGRVVVQVEGGF
jgi:NADPH:quinone reductase-like Zn-dependent oxidoreductase